MVTPRLAAIVPAKSFAVAKTRLSPLLSLAERMALCSAMLEDVLSAVAAAPEISETLVVTSEPKAATIAARYGARIVAEAFPHGLNPAIAAATEAAARSGVEAVIIVPADIPGLTLGVLGRAARRLSTERSAVLARAIADGGTNLLGVRPADLIGPLFGPGSFDRHLDALRTAGVDPAILESDETDHDIDRPADIERFWSLRTQTRTQALLDTIGIADRLEGRSFGRLALNGAPA